jgi:hypothetical protein
LKVNVVDVIDETMLRNRLQSVLELQDGINSKIRADWREADNAWYRAIWTECAEMLDHIGWKWWKHQAPDLPQVHLELVDIFHFGLSEKLQQHGAAQSAADQLMKDYVLYGKRGTGRRANAGFEDAESTIAHVETLATSVLTTRRFDMAAFCKLATAVDLQEEMLYEMYVGKNVLNMFRQDHGYKSGMYMKTWDGCEDNMWLIALSADLSKDPKSFPTELYQRLLIKYKEVTRAR